MAQNDVNLYVTFTECSPVVPLESLEMGVPCITGNNHHYFKDSKLYDYLVVKSEDDINEIAQKIKLCLEKRRNFNIVSRVERRLRFFCQAMLESFYRVLRREEVI